MIKIITYIAILSVVILMGLNLAMSHALATDGEKLTKLSNESKELQKEVGRLKRNATEAKSLSSILTKAKDLGLTELAIPRMVKDQNLADAINLEQGQ